MLIAYIQLERKNVKHYVRSAQIQYTPLKLIFIKSTSKLFRLKFSCSGTII